MKMTAKPLKAFKPSTARVLVLLEQSQLKKTGIWKILGKDLESRIEQGLSWRVKAPAEGETFIVQGRPEIWISVLPKIKNSFSLLGHLGKVAKQVVVPELDSFSVVNLYSKLDKEISHSISAALETTTFIMPNYGKRSEKAKNFKLKDIIFYSEKTYQKLLEWGSITAEGTNMVRALGTMPPNYLNTESYGKKIAEIASAQKLGFKFISNKELKKMGAGAFTAVDQANPESKGGIYEITYHPKKAKNKQEIALVGKGLCYDTGGYDVKTNGYMAGMKGDMTGSALALANLVVASKLKLPLKMKAYLGVTENHISPRGYKADDVVIALNGMSIEVINTDAEGRMVLADTLCLASQAKPELIIDYATLTGAAHIAIGNSMSAAISNREAFHGKIIQSGKESGERVWPFPLEEDFGKALESQVADIIQCVKARSPDHLMAAYFLSKFVGENIPWIHIDLSSADRDGGLAHVDSVFTGFGVRWTMQFLKNQYRI